MDHRWLAVPLLASVFYPAALMAQGTPAQSLLVLSKHDRTLAIVDPGTLQVVSRVPVGDDPHEVIASSDGRTAYVSNYGFGRFHTLAVVDLTTAKALPSIDLGPLNGPHGLFFVGGETWFTAEGAKAIGRYDPASNKIDMILGTGQNRTHMIWVSADAQRIITTNVNSGTVSLIAKEEVRAPTGMRPSSRSVTAPRASTSRPLAASCGSPTPATAPSPSSISPRTRSSPPSRRTSPARTG